MTKHRLSLECHTIPLWLAGVQLAACWSDAACHVWELCWLMARIHRVFDVRTILACHHSWSLAEPTGVLLKTLFTISKQFFKIARTRQGRPEQNLSLWNTTHDASQLRKLKKWRGTGHLHHNLMLCLLACNGNSARNIPCCKWIFDILEFPARTNWPASRDMCDIPSKSVSHSTGIMAWQALNTIGRLCNIDCIRQTRRKDWLSLLVHLSNDVCFGLWKWFLMANWLELLAAAVGANRWLSLCWRSLPRTPICTFRAVSRKLPKVIAAA